MSIRNGNAISLATFLLLLCAPEVKCEIAAGAVPVRATEWAVQGAPISSASGVQELAQVASDGLGGAYVAWQDRRDSSSAYKAYLARVSAGGVTPYLPGWPVDGLRMSSGYLSQGDVDVAGDGFGGAIVSWSDSHDGELAVYVQRVDPYGKILWSPTGVRVGRGALGHPAPDGTGGAFVVRLHIRPGGSHTVGVARVSATGSVTGVSFFNGLDSTYECSNVDIAAAGVGRALIAWEQADANAFVRVFKAAIDTFATTPAWADTVCAKYGGYARPRIVYGYSDMPI